ncbi:thioredoxin-like protein [Fomitiporia mediterranea MF3/22]|uniref:thioredoxin-like protein n=1 Tax=Fomitiporia mediterranea (strain MF3/22) TaxID=694068 RepID=UPI0004409366|nr:thioredoxin-like protein [Fomitiporia mediterranea MF3/22]EJD00507.1 thioredoxin-like protein [Fomitiporia mediterranea MF3/22]
MVVKLIGASPSVCTHGVAVALKEINVPYEILLVNFAHMKNKDFLEQKQAFGQIPVLVEDEDCGFKLFESRAIARYLIAKHAPNSKLIPKEPKANVLFEQAMSIENNDSQRLLCTCRRVGFRKVLQTVPMSTPPSTPLHWQKKLEGYECILSKQKYLTGDELTLTDLLHLPIGTLITEQLGFKDSKQLLRYHAGGMIFHLASLGR